MERSPHHEIRSFSDTTPSLLLLLELDYISALSYVLRHLPDLSRGVTRIHTGKCEAHELVGVLSAFSRMLKWICTHPLPRSMAESTLLRASLDETAHENLLQKAESYLSQLNSNGLKGGTYLLPSMEEEMAPEIVLLRDRLAAVEAEFLEEIVSIRSILKKPGLNFRSLRTA